MKEFFDILFDKGEGICTGDAYSTEVFPYPKEAEYFSINPLHLLEDKAYFLNPDKYKQHVPRRADLNVTTFRNFMFEMDSVALEDQLKIFRNSAIPFTSIVYSGGKSYHAILSVDKGAGTGVHTLDGVDDYKKMWRRLAARIDKEARKLGYAYPEGSNTFLDSSCQNPSRLSRYPGVYRSNGNMQEVVQLTERMDLSDFLNLLSECPVVYSFRNRDFQAPEDELETSEQFEAIASKELIRKLKIVDWANSEGMYPQLLKLSLWAIDETNVGRAAFVDFLEKYTFGTLVKKGYPSHKLMTAIDHAFGMKGR